VSSTTQILPPRAKLNTLPIDQRRGMQAMWLVIVTEFVLFACMFAAYYYLGSNKDRWADETPPVLIYAIILLIILLSSSAVLAWGERQVKAERFSAGRAALWLTVLLGIGFLALQGFEYFSHWRMLAPYSDSYGSIFYAITSLHAAHVIVGLLLLMYVGILPRYGPTRRTPHHTYSTVALYWHFVDAVWLLIVTLLYIIPHFQAHLHGH
jgi:heme/copper-type cytochrome/quinol oxidase subunit 3